MNKKTFYAKDFSSRQDLEKYISAETGTDNKANRDNLHEIRGTRKQLVKLFLDDLKNVWGVKIVITNTPTRKLIEEKNARI